MALYLAVHRVRSAWQTTLFWCRGFFGFGSAFLTIFCKSSSYSRNQIGEIFAIEHQAKIRLLYNMQSYLALENHPPSVFENIGHELLEIMVIVYPNSKK